MLNPKNEDIKKTNTNVPRICPVADNIKDFPKLINSETLISKPTIKSNRVTPTSESECKTSLLEESKNLNVAINIPVNI